MGISPGSLVFHWDMFLDIPLIADLYLLQQSRQVLIDKQLMMANAKKTLLTISQDKKCSN